MSHRHHEYFDVYCCLPHEFLVSYPQPRASFDYQQIKYRNTNAVERTSSSRLSKYKPKNLLDPYKRSKDHYANEMHTVRRRMINKIMSIESSDHEVELTRSDRHDDPSQMADGDKKDLKSFKNPISHRIDQSVNRISSWRKLQANITASHYNPIQQFQRERRHQREQHHHRLLSIPHPIMVSPLIKQRVIENSERTKSISDIINSSMSSTSLSINSSTNLTDSNSNHKPIRSINEDQPALDDENSNVTIPVTSLLKTEHQSEISKETITIENEELLENDSFNNISNSLKTSSLKEIENIEEFQPVIEIVSPTQVPSVLLNDILSSFFPTISTSPANSNTIDNNSKIPYILFDNTSNMTELLLMGQTSVFIQSDFIPEQRQQRKVHSLFESIEELCLLIRKLLQYELTEQKITSLQATIASQLAILLTYLAMPNHENGISSLRTANTLEKMTSTEEENVSFEKFLVSTIGTQTDFDDSISKPRIMSSENIHSHTNAVVHDLIEFKAYQSSDNKQQGTIDILSLSQKETSHTDLISSSMTLHLPGRRLNHALSDTFIYHIHHHQQYSSSHHQLISFSETTIHSLTKEQTQHLLKRIGQKFQHYVELESSNTWLGASTEFTPDFLLTTMNSSKYDDDDQTQQFGIDTEKQDYQIENQPKIDTLTFNSTEKENYDSLELDILNNEFNIEEEEISKSLITESNSLFFNDDSVSPVIHQMNKEKYFCQLLEPLLATYQWQVPILPRKTNSIDLIYEKRSAKIDFKYSKIRSNSNNGIHMIGKQVRIKSNPSSRASTPTIKSHSKIQGQEQPKKLSALNFNNNCHESDYSIQSLPLSSTSCDSLCSFDSDTLDKNYTKQCILLPKDHRLLMYHPESDGRTLPRSSYLSDVTDKLDSNIAIAQTLLNMINSFDNNHNNHPSAMKFDLLHMYIRQFLIEFDTRIRLARKKSSSTSLEL